MNVSHKKRSLDLIILLILTAAVCIMKSIAASIDLDFSSGHYDSGTLITVAGWITFVGGVTLFVKGLFSGSHKKLIPSFSSPITYIPTAIVALALLFMAKGMFEKRARAVELLLPSYATPPYATLALICAILSIAAAAGCLLYIIFSNPRDYRRAWSGILTILFLCVYSIYLYFSTELPINSPNKICDELAIVFVALFLLYDVRITLKREIWHAYRGFGYIAALLAAYSAIPSITVYFIKGEIISNSIYESFLLLAFFIFIMARLILLGELDCEEYSSYVSAMAGAFNERVLGSLNIKSESSDEEEPEAEKNEEASDLEQLVIDADAIPADYESKGDEERTDL